MIKYFLHKIELRKLFNKLDKFEKDYNNLLKERANNGDIHCALEDIKWVENDIDAINTKYFIDLARRNFLPIPELSNNEFWECSIYDKNRKILTNKGISYIKGLIYKQRKESFESYGIIITAISGLIGALIGFASVLK